MYIVYNLLESVMYKPTFIFGIQLLAHQIVTLNSNNIFFDSKANEILWKN